MRYMAMVSIYLTTVSHCGMYDIRIYMFRKGNPQSNEGPKAYTGIHNLYQCAFELCVIEGSAAEA